jgi:hypothetical protein
MAEVVKHGRLEVMGYREILATCEILPDSHGRKLGV